MRFAYSLGVALTPKLTPHLLLRQVLIFYKHFFLPLDLVIFEIMFMWLCRTIILFYIFGKIFVVIKRKFTNYVIDLSMLVVSVC